MSRIALAGCLTMATITVSSCGGQAHAQGPSVRNPDQLADFARQTVQCKSFDADTSKDLGAWSDAVSTPVYRCRADANIYFGLVKDFGKLQEVAAQSQRAENGQDFVLDEPSHTLYGSSIVVVSQDKDARPALANAGLRYLLCADKANQYLGTKEQSAVQGCVFVAAPPS